MITVIGIMFGLTLSGSVVSETVFALPGIGRERMLLVGAAIRLTVVIALGAGNLRIMLVHVRPTAWRRWSCSSPSCSPTRCWPRPRLASSACENLLGDGLRHLLDPRLKIQQGRAPSSQLTWAAAPR